MTQSEILIEVQGLEKEFCVHGATVSVLRGLDFSIACAERVAVVGESGSGKTTLMHILGTLDKPSRGKCLFAGTDMFALKAARLDAFRNRHMGFVFQFHQLLGEFSALENIMLPALISGQRHSQAQIQAQILLDQVGLSHRGAHKPGQLSGGEQQRVAIARALVLRPQILIADEPTGNLDTATSAGIYSLLEELHAEYGLTMVVVTHNMDLAARMDRVLQLRDGVLEPA